MSLRFLSLRGFVTTALLLSPLGLAAQTAPLIPTPDSSARAAEPTTPVYQAIYHRTTPEEVTAVLNRVLAFMDQATPGQMVAADGQPITDLSQPLPAGATPARGGTAGFNLVGYEQGVAYAGMLAAGEATGDARFTDYTAKRFAMIGALAAQAAAAGGAGPAPVAATGAAQGVPGAGLPGQGRGRGGPGGVRPLTAPAALDDCGAMDAALIKAQRAKVGPDLMKLINTGLDFISTKQFRLPDGTLARHWPIPESVWADDMYMSVPALAQMGKLTGNNSYYDDAVKQVVQISQRLFQPELGLYRHGWVSVNPDSIDIHWGRANGWCIMAMCELLDVLPPEHPGYNKVLGLYRAHVQGLAKLQSGYGLWNQLLDRTDSYLETSASAMYAYGIARGINRGWLSPVYGMLAMTGWNAVATRVNAQGQVEGTCIGTNLDFDLPYYYFRPTSVFAVHGYGPVLMAGAEMLTLLKNPSFTITPRVNSIYFVPTAGAASPYMEQGRASTTH
jgi:rhamnogalacturonyl hydrolase YesR